MKNGDTTVNLQLRCALLAEFYPLNTKKNSTSLTPYTLDAKDSLVNIWDHFYGEPVASRRTECSNIYCLIGQSTKVPYLVVNHNTICNEGFGKLEKAIATSYTKRCRKIGCGGVIQVSLECNETIFIESDVTNIQQKTPVKCQLHHLPVDLNLGKMYR